MAYNAAMTRALAILATLAVILASLLVSAANQPVSAQCIMSYCRDRTSASTPAPGERRAITNPSRQRLGDVYNPGHGRRLQLRDTSRRIIGYIERDGTVTNTSRQKVGTIELGD